MGHSLGVPCLHEDPDHEGGCSSVVISPFVDHDATKYWEVTETSGRLAYWRTNHTAMSGIQVEHRWADGSWHASLLFDTEAGFLRSVPERSRRDITAEEVPALSDEDRRENAMDVLFERTQDANITDQHAAVQADDYFGASGADT